MRLRRLCDSRVVTKISALTGLSADTVGGVLLFPVLDSRVGGGPTEKHTHTNTHTCGIMMCVNSKQQNNQPVHTLFQIISVSVE